MRTCDRCGRSEEVVEIRGYDIRWAGGRVNADLCPSDDGPLRELLDRLPAETKRPRRVTMEGDMVVNPEDVPPAHG